jgi:hypothetical protein
MPPVTLDRIENLTVDSQDYFNEIRTIQYLSKGLFQLASVIRQREEAWRQQTSDKYNVEIYGRDFDGTIHFLDTFACFFHWFGVSVLNRTRLVGLIRSLANGDISRNDLSNRAGHKAVTNAVGGYVASIPELTDVRVWRDKVAAHFAITDPFRDDNIATLESSVIFPLSFSNGRYVVGGMALARKDDSGTHTSQLPCWSVTEVWEALAPRYWPSAGNLLSSPGSPSAAGSVPPPAAPRR